MATLPVRRAKQSVRAAEDNALPKIGFIQAKAEFDELFDRVLKDGPVEITCDGEDAVVAVSKREWLKMHNVVIVADVSKAEKRSAADFWLNSPLRGSGVELGPIKQEPQKPVQNMAEFLLNSPMRGSGLKIGRLKLKPRKLEF